MRILAGLGLFAAFSGCATLNNQVEDKLNEKYEGKKPVAKYIGKDTMIVRMPDNSVQYILSKKNGRNCTLLIENGDIYDEGCDEIVDKATVEGVTCYRWDQKCEFPREGQDVPDQMQVFKNKNNLEAFFKHKDSELKAFKKLLLVNSAERHWSGSWSWETLKKMNRDKF